MRAGGSARRHPTLQGGATSGGYGGQSSTASLSGLVGRTLRYALCWRRVPFLVRRGLTPDVAAAGGRRVAGTQHQHAEGQQAIVAYVLGIAGLKVPPLLQLSTPPPDQRRRYSCADGGHSEPATKPDTPADSRDRCGEM
ncbi:hypothetical protein LSAT2_028766 [Lamellibrachia satsuma]|nr:hypothetical protein LSAT2_028766 [Lamellibrachia satsuma]